MATPLRLAQQAAPHHQPQSDIQVTPASKWCDPQWQFDAVRPGAKSYNSVIRWGISIGADRTLLSAGAEDLLETLRLVAWSSLQGLNGAKAKKPHTVLVMLLDLGALLRWMEGEGLTCFSQIDSATSQRYFEHLVKTEGGNDGLGKSRLLGKASALSDAFHHRKAALDAGLPFFPEAPFDGLPLGERVKNVDAKEQGWIEPLPDDVAIRILDTATRWLDGPIADICRLRDEMMALSIKKRSLRKKRAYAALKLSDHLAKFQFSVGADGQPWRGPIVPGSDISFETGQPITRTEMVTRVLLNDATAACLCLLQGSTGLRISEIAAIRAGVDSATGLPSCVSIRKSKSGLNELLFLKSQAEKIHDGQRMEWLLGMRPAGADYLPLPVRAILALQELHQPWRDMAGMDDLLVSYGDRARNLAVEAENVSSVSSTALLFMCKAFVAQRCGLDQLPDTLHSAGSPVDITPYKSGEGFKTHQWRKTFALYVLRSDPRMLPALAQHFKHMSLAMTEQGYIGNDPELLESLDSMRRQKTIQFLVEQASGERPVAGGMADLVREQRAELEKLAREGGIEQWMVENDLRIWFSDHGKCFVNIAPSESRCHALGQTDPWLSAQPNYEHRSPSVCASCKCFAVDGEHRVFWERRLKANQEALDAASGQAGGEYRVAKERVAQAKSILKALDKRPNTTDQKEP